MAVSAISKLARSLRRHCMARPAFAALLALGLGGAVAGGAMALSPTVDTGLAFRGGVNIVSNNFTAGAKGLVYTVPAGRKFMLTDLVIANDSEATAATDQYVYTGETTSCAAVAAFRTSFLTVPAGDTLHLPFITGIGFTAGQGVCVQNGQGPGGSTTHWTIRGFLFE